QPQSRAPPSSGRPASPPPCSRTDPPPTPSTSLPAAFASSAPSVLGEGPVLAATSPLRYDLMLALAVLVLAAAPAPMVLDDFEDVHGWSAHPSDGVELRIGQDRGLNGKAMRLDFDFHGGAGYAIARKAFPLKLPADYELSFRIRADAPVNDLEL